MQPDSFIKFNTQETKLMFDQELFPIKRMIIEKLSLLFQSTIENLKDTPIHKQFSFPIGTDLQNGKISKGENHLQFPYVVLDFPRKFEQEHIFCFRNMFWFGHFFSTSLILSGKYVEIYQNQFMMHKKILENKKIYFSLEKNPWINEEEMPVSILIETLSDDQMINHIAKNQFIKLTHRFVHTDTKMIIQTICSNYESMIFSISRSTNPL